MSDRRPRESREHGTPPLFEGVDDRSDTSAEDAPSGAGLERLVTRVAARPRHWSMKWRPNEADAPEDVESDRHPARAVTSPDPTGEEASERPEAGTLEEIEEVHEALDVENTEPVDDIEAIDAIGEADPGDPEVPAGSPALVLAGDSISDTDIVPSIGTALESDAGLGSEHGPDDESASIPAVVTSRTWSAPDASSRRHPTTPTTSESAVASPTPARHRSRPSTPSPARGVRSIFAVAGWLIAIGLGVGWATRSGGTASSTLPESPASDSSGPVLARPAADAFEAELARDEIASLRHERARLMQEVEAAAILLEDHRRISRSLRDSTTTNEGAAVELHVLEENARRWERRHEVAVTRLDELAQLLLEADAREEMMADQLRALEARLQALDGSVEAD